jgi:excisionase family DNA binding protein
MKARKPAEPSSTKRADRLLVGANDAAEILSISQRLLWTLTNKGDIPCVRIGRRILYAPSDLTAWVESMKQGDIP